MPTKPHAFASRNHRLIVDAVAVSATGWSQSLSSASINSWTAAARMLRIAVESVASVPASFPVRGVPTTHLSKHLRGAQGSSRSLGVPVQTCRSVRSAPSRRGAHHNDRRPGDRFTRRSLHTARSVTEVPVWGRVARPSDRPGRRLAARSIFRSEVLRCGSSALPRRHREGRSGRSGRA